MDLILIKVFFEGQTRNMRNTKNDEKSMNFMKMFCVCVCEGCRFESHPWRRVYFIMMRALRVCFASEGVGSNPARRSVFF